MECERDFRLRNAPFLQTIPNVTIAIAGAGGIGSNLAVLLTRLGFVNLLVVDFDVVEYVNLNRQHYTTHDVNKVKVEALKSHLEAINPVCNVTIINTKITSLNQHELFKDYEIVCEAFDEPSEKAMLFHERTKEDKFVIGCSGMAGSNLSSMRIKCLGERAFVCGDFGVDQVESGGMMAHKVMHCATLMAECVLRILKEKQ